MVASPAADILATGGEGWPSASFAAGRRMGCLGQGQPLIVARHPAPLLFFNLVAALTGERRQAPSFLAALCRAGMRGLASTPLHKGTSYV